MKVCIRCGNPRALDEFYAHPMMRDGRLNKCAGCCKEQAMDRHYRLMEDPGWVARERARGRRKEKLSRRRSATRASRAAWRRRNPEKVRAHAAVQRALRSGVLVKPDRCEGCGNQNQLQGHHADYAKPLEVRWLCTECHGMTWRKPSAFLTN